MLISLSKKILQIVEKKYTSVDFFLYICIVKRIVKQNIIHHVKVSKVL